MNIFFAFAAASFKEDASCKNCTQLHKALNNDACHACTSLVLAAVPRFFVAIPWRRCVVSCLLRFRVRALSCHSTARSLSCSRSQIYTEFHRDFDKRYPDPMKALCAGVHDVALSPLQSRKSSLDWAFELTTRERSLSQESQDSTVSDNSAATPVSFATVSTVTVEFAEFQCEIEYNGDDEGSDQCPVPSCTKKVHHGKPCKEEVPEGAHPDWADADYAAALTYYNSVFLKDEPPKTPPMQVMAQPEAPPPIKRRRFSIMEPLDAKFQGKRQRFDALLFNDSE
jgi:hypothetical protein